MSKILFRWQEKKLYIFVISTRVKWNRSSHENALPRIHKISVKHWPPKTLLTSAAVADVHVPRKLWKLSRRSRHRQKSVEQNYAKSGLSRSTRSLFGVVSPQFRIDQTVCSFGFEAWRFPFSERRENTLASRSSGRVSAVGSPRNRSSRRFESRGKTNCTERCNGLNGLAEEERWNCARTETPWNRSRCNVSFSSASTCFAKYYLYSAVFAPRKREIKSAMMRKGRRRKELRVGECIPFESPIESLQPLGGLSRQPPTPFQFP